MTTQSVQVKIELGHRATTRKRKTHEGFTHDWAVFVRGPEGSNIQHFVEKVVFHLHDSFPKPKRVLKEPPYQVAESGYAGFNLNIEIFFKNKEEPRKILFSYDLFLHAEGFPPVNHIRCEKLTFKNPTEEFRRKLIKAGGIGVLGPEDHAQFQQPAAPQSMSPPPSGNVAKPQTPEAAGKTLPEQATKSDSGKKPKLASSTSSSSSKPASIYGSGSIGSKPKSTSVAASAANSTPKTQSSIHSSSTVSPPSMKEHKEHSKSSHRDKEKDKLKVKEKSGVKRQTESGHDSAKKKRKESTETKSREKEKERDREKEREKHKSKSSKDAKESKSKSSSSSSKKESSKNKHETDSKSTSKSAPSSNSKAKNEVNGKSSAASFSAKSNSDLFDDELSLSSDNSDVEITEGPVPGSPESSLSFSSMKAGSGTGTGALSTLWAEIDETVGNEEDEMLSPLPRNSPPSLFSQSIPTPPVFEKPPSVEKKETGDSKKNSSPQSSSSSQKSKSRRKEKESSTSKKSSKSERKSNKDSKDRRRSKETKENKPRETSWHQDSQQVAQNGKDLEEEDMDIEIGESHEINSIHDLTERDLNGEKAPNGEFLTVLCELQEQLMSMTDRGLLARVVKVIEQTGKYKINEATFDFDLCSLDADTVLRLKKCLKQS